TKRTGHAGPSFALSTELSDHLVRKGIPFRQAHALVGRLVAGCLASARELSDLTLQKLHAASPHFVDVPELTPAASVRRKQTAGSTHPDEIERQIEALEKEIAERRATLTPQPTLPPAGEEEQRNVDVGEDA